MGWGPRQFLQEAFLAYLMKADTLLDPTSCSGDSGDVLVLPSGTSDW